LGGLTSQIPPIKMTAVGLPLRGSGVHDDGKNLVNDHVVAEARNDTTGW